MHLRLRHTPWALLALTLACATPQQSHRPHRAPTARSRGRDPAPAHVPPGHPGEAHGLQGGAHGGPGAGGLRGRGGDRRSQLSESTRQVWLHGTGLKVKEATLTAGGPPQPARAVTGSDSLHRLPAGAPGGSRHGDAARGVPGPRTGEGDGGPLPPEGGRRTGTPTPSSSRSARGASSRASTSRASRCPGSSPSTCPRATWPSPTRRWCPRSRAPTGGKTYRFAPDAAAAQLPHRLRAWAPSSSSTRSPRARRRVPHAHRLPKGRARRGRLCREGDAADSRPPGALLRHRPTRTRSWTCWPSPLVSAAPWSTRAW